jgi:EAL domain-containing protein (putative c-di-GMP-specific phosphodiesterase class I)
VKVAGTSLTFEEALARADVALDNAKEHGGARGIVFGPDLETVATQRVLERDAVLAALHNEEFVLEYQPTFRMTTREIAGAEALLRWDHPTRGRLQPFAFLSAVRRANLLTEVTSWIVARIARDFAGVAVPSGLRVYFNAPAHALESETFLLGLEETLAAHPGFADQLGIEITESEAMNRVERAIEALERIRRLGLLVAIDDFGTGYSSLSYLKRLPIDIVKLDKNFIDGIPDGANDVALAEMFLTLTRQFSLISVGEGIETERQAAWLLEHGCMIGQGYLFARPLPLGALLELLNGRAVRP